jgi:hypothetical protein
MRPTSFEFVFRHMGQKVNLSSELHFARCIFSEIVIDINCSSWFILYMIDNTLFVFVKDVIILKIEDWNDG